MSRKWRIPIVILAIVLALIPLLISTSLYPLFKICRLEIVESARYESGTFEVNLIEGYSHFNKTSRMTEDILEIALAYNREATVIIKNNYNRTWDKYSTSGNILNISQNIKNIEVPEDILNIYLDEADMNWNMAEYLYEQFVGAYPNITHVEVIDFEDESSRLSFIKTDGKWSRKDGIIGLS